VDLVPRPWSGTVCPLPGLDLPGRKSEYLRAAAKAALDGLLHGVAVRALGRIVYLKSDGRYGGLGNRGLTPSCLYIAR